MITAAECDEERHDPHFNLTLTWQEFLETTKFPSLKKTKKQEQKQNKTKSKVAQLLAMMSK